MSGARPDSEAARRGGLVPFTGSSNGRNNNDGSANKSSGYPNISSNKAGNFAAANSVPENVKSSSKGGNDQLWSNGSGSYTQGSAPVWPGSQQGAPTAPTAPASQSNNNRQTGGPGPVGGGYIQAPQSANSPGPQQQPGQEQPANWQGRNVQQGVPVSSDNYQSGGGYIQGPPGANASHRSGGGNVQGPPGARNVQQGVPVNSDNNQSGGGYVQGPPGANGSHQPNLQGSQGGLITQGPQRGPVPKGDYVYYDGSGNQVHPGGPPPAESGSGSERHFHHHYYYNQEQAAAPVGYPYDKKLEERKKRRPGAKTLAAALIACWACTCCCHAPCGC